MKASKILYYIGVTMSMLMGLWHFFVPWMAYGQFIGSIIAILVLIPLITGMKTRKK